MSMIGESKSLIDSLSAYFTPSNKRQSRVAQNSFLNRPNFTQSSADEDEQTETTEDDEDEDEKPILSNSERRRLSKDYVSDDKPSTSGSTKVGELSQSHGIHQKRRKLATRRSVAAAKTRTSQLGSLIDGLSHHYATVEESRKRAAPGSYLDLVKGVTLSRSRSNSQPRSPSIVSSGLSGDESRRRQKSTERVSNAATTSKASATISDQEPPTPTVKRARAPTTKGAKKIIEKDEKTIVEKIQKRTLDQVDPSRKLAYCELTNFIQFSFLLIIFTF